MQLMQHHKTMHVYVVTGAYHARKASKRDYNFINSKIQTKPVMGRDNSLQKGHTSELVELSYMSVCVVHSGTCSNS